MEEKSEKHFHPHSNRGEYQVTKCALRVSTHMMFRTTKITIELLRWRYWINGAVFSV